MSSVVTTSENGLKMKIKRRGSTGKVVSDVENISGLTSPFKQKFILESDNNDKKKPETMTKLSTKILQSGKNKGKNKKQSKPMKEKKIKKRIHRVGNATNIGKCLSSSDKNRLDCSAESNNSKLNGTVEGLPGRDNPSRKDSSPSADTMTRSLHVFQISQDANSLTNSSSKASEKQTDKSTEVIMKDVETETNHVGIITDPDCLGPCEPGTSVVLEGIVWNESDNGILVVNVTWRGKTYVGTLMDSTKHHWAPPRFSEEELNTSTQYAHGGWGGTGHHHQKSRSEENSSETRKPRRCRKDAAALASHNSRTSKNSQVSNSAGSAKENLLSGSEAQSSKNKVGLFECQEENCSKKFKHVAGLRYHQSHAHCNKKDKSSASESRSLPSAKSSEKLPSRTKSPEDTSSKTSPVTTSCTITTDSTTDPISVAPKMITTTSQPELSFEELSNRASSTDLAKSLPILDAFPSLKEEPKSNPPISKNSSLSLTRSPEVVPCKPSSTAENLTKDGKPPCSEEKTTSPLSNSSLMSPPILSRKEVYDLRVDSRERPFVPMDSPKTNEARVDPLLTTPNNLPHRPHEFKESTKKHSSVTPSQESHRQLFSFSSSLAASSASSSSSSSSSSSLSTMSSSNVRKHHSTPDSFPMSKKLKTSEETREEDPFYKAFRSMFEHPLHLDYFMDPLYRSQTFPMMNDPMMFHKNLESRNKFSKNFFDDMKPVDMSSKKAPTPKPEVHGFWPTYLPSASTSQSPGNFFGHLKDCGPDVSSRSLCDNFSSPLPSPKEKSLPKLQRFAPTSRFHDPGGRCPSTGGSKDEGPLLKNYERDFSYKPKRNEEQPNQKNGKVKDDHRRPPASNFPKQDVFRSPLPPPLLPSSFPFFSSQHPGNYSSLHLSPYNLDSLEKSPNHSRHQSSHLSPTVGERFKFTNSMEPSPSSKHSSSGSVGLGGSGRSSIVSLPSTSKSHLENPPAPKHHLHTHHHTHIIKTPYPMYSQYAASLLTSPPIVPTVVVPEIFSPK